MKVKSAQQSNTLNANLTRQVLREDFKCSRVPRLRIVTERPFHNEGTAPKKIKTVVNMQPS